MPEVVVIGSFVQDLSFKTNEFPEPGATRIGTFKTGPGGKGFNQAIACSRMGVDTLFLGAVGKDAFANALTSFVESEALRISLEEIENESSGAASIVVNASGENSIVVALGANGELSSDFIRKHKSDIQSASVIVSQAESNLAAGVTAFSLAKEQGITTLLNPAPINSELSMEFLELANILTPNETEFSFLLEHFFDRTVAHPENCSDEELNELCALFPCQTVALTLGSAGSAIFNKGHLYRVEPIAVDAIDTTGAGDAFSGGLAAGLIRHPDSFEAAARFASVVAGLSVESYGTAPAMPSLETLRKRFPEHQ